MDWTFNMSGFSYQTAFSTDSLNKFMLNYRLNVIDRFVNEEFIHNKNYLKQVREFNEGNVREIVCLRLKEKYDITGTNVEINKLIDRKCIQLIRAIYV